MQVTQGMDVRVAWRLSEWTIVALGATMLLTSRRTDVDWFDRR